MMFQPRPRPLGRSMQCQVKSSQVNQSPRTAAAGQSSTHRTIRLIQKLTFARSGAFCSSMQCIQLYRRTGVVGRAEEPARFKMAVRSTMTAILVAVGACTSPLAGAATLTSIAPPGFKESPTSFCEHDHALGVPYPNAATVTACAAACTSANGFAFEWNCNGTKAPMCIVFRTASDCGDLKRSGCGTTVRCMTHDAWAVTNAVCMHGHAP
jgi:hypothetical protein